MQRLLLFFVLVSSWFAASSRLYGQRVRLFGTVKDNEGNPIELAVVHVKGTADGTLTNLKGEYSFRTTTRDTVEVIYSFLGYETRRRQFFSPTDSIRVDVVLPSSASMLGEATVRATQVQTGTVQQLHLNESRTAPSTTGNAVEEMIATQAGVSSHNELSSQYNVRGGSFDENCVYINGIEIYRPQLVSSGQQEGLSVINAEMVQDIGFSSGGFAAQYGDKMSSVLDITYKKPRGFEASVNGSLLGSGLYVGWGNEKVNFMTSVRYKTTAYLLGTMDTDAEYETKYLDYQAYLSWQPSEHFSLEVLGNISDNHYTFRPEDRETSFGTMDNPLSFKVYFDGQEKDYFRTYFGALTLTHYLGKNNALSLQVSAYSTAEHETYDIQGEYWLQETGAQEQLGVGTYMEHARNRLWARVINTGLRFSSKFTGHEVLAGFNWKAERVEEHSREWEMRDSMGYSLPHSDDQLHLIYSLTSQTDMTSNRIEAFAQDSWRFNTRLGLFRLTYGLRLSHWDWNSETVVSPRVSVGLLPAANENWTLRFATGFYYQTPFYKELKDTTLQDGIATVTLNRDIKSQRSIHFVLGADYRFRVFDRPFIFTTEIYYKVLSDLIPYTVDNVRIVYTGRNSSDGYAAGIDFKLFGEFVPGADSWVTFSVMGTKETIDGITVPRPTDQRYNLSLYFTDYFPGTTRWRLTLKAALAGGLPFGPPRTEVAEHTYRAPAYKRVDIGLSYRLVDNEDRHIVGFGHLLKNVWLGLDCFNVFDIDNVNSYYWITATDGTQYAVPNYLTGRQINFRVAIDF